MNAERLVAMANDIANFFHAEPDRNVAVDGVVGHLRRYWEPRMRRKIVAHFNATGGGELNELARAAVARLAETDPAQAERATG